MFKQKAKEWEIRERKKTRDYEKQITKDERKKQEEQEERTHLLEFLEEYDDDRDDIKYYKYVFVTLFHWKISRN